MKKYLAEFIGTLVLVLFGCGTAAVSGGALGITQVVGISLAFGLSIVAMAYSIGNVSGCHVNPAVSFAMLLSGKMSVKDFVGYVVAQILGGLAGAGLLKLIIMCCTSQYDVITSSFSGLGTNGFGDASFNSITCTGAIVVEIILTFVFVLVILGVTSSEKFSSVAGIVIGLALTFVHLFGIPLTGTSVNPARSLGPAVLSLVDGNTTPISQVWVFIVAPLAGAALAAFVWMILTTNKAAADTVAATPSADASTEESAE